MEVTQTYQCRSPAFATDLADRVCIIERGEVRYEGKPSELASYPEARAKYLMV